MSDKTFKICLIVINIFVAAVVIGAIISFPSFVKKETTAISSAAEVMTKQFESNKYNQVNSTPNSAASQENDIEAQTIEQTKPTYVVTEYNGKLAVFLEGESKPYMEMDIWVNDLTQEDVKLLRKGIKVFTAAQLLDVLEDYDY